MMTEKKILRQPATAQEDAAMGWAGPSLYGPISGGLLAAGECTAADYEQQSSCTCFSPGPTGSHCKHCRFDLLCTYFRSEGRAYRA